MTDGGTSMDKLREAVAEAVYVFDPVWIPANTWKGLQISPGHHLTWSQLWRPGAMRIIDILRVRPLRLSSPWCAASLR